MGHLKIHHVGYFVKNIEKAAAMFLHMGFTVEKEEVYDEWRDINIVFLIKDGYRVELVSTASKKSPVYGLQKKVGNAPYHICYQVKNIEKAIKSFEENGFKPLGTLEAAPAIENQRVIFMFGSNIGMIELLEEK